jgi:predicted permease
LLLNISDIPRPEEFISLSDILVPSGSLLLVFTLGLSIELKPNMYWRTLAIRMALLRSFLAPLVGIGVALLLGFSFQEYPLVFKVVVVLAMMPAGFISLLPPVLYGVDRHLASTTWLFSTLIFIVTLSCLLTFNAFY